MTPSAVGAAFVAWSGPLAVELVVLGLIAWIVDRARGPRGGRIWPEARAGLWMAVLLRPWVPAGALSIHGDGPIGALLPHVGGPARLALGGPSQPATWPIALALAWAVGAAAIAVALAVRARRTTRAIHRGSVTSSPAVRSIAEEIARELGLPRAPGVLVTPRIHSPALIGLARTRVALPLAVHNGERQALRDVLRHELAHAARRDPWRALLTQLAVLAVWWHPAAWLARRRLAALREIACDARATRHGDAARYRDTLLDLARPLAAAPHGLPLLGALRSGGVLLERLDRLTRPRPSRARLAVAPALTVGALAICLTTPPEPPITALLPPLDELEGCFQLRYAVFGLAGDPAAAAELALTSNDT